MSDLEAMREKIRALVADFGYTSSEIRVKESNSTFKLSEENITAISQVQINGVVTTGYSYDSTNNILTISASGFTSGDSVEIFYTYNDYTDSELNKYVKASLTFISLYSSVYTDYEIEDDDVIYPTPDNAVTDLICIISSILIKPNYSRYSMPGGVTVDYPNTKCKEEKIQGLISEYEAGDGVTGLITVL